MKNSMKIFLVLLASASLFIFSACGGGSDDPAPTTETGSVTGTVTDADTDALLSGVLVSIGSVNDTTGTDGVYTLSSVEVGNKTITASLDGYQTYTGFVTVTQEVEATENIQLPPADNTTFQSSEYFPLGQGDTWTLISASGSLGTSTVSGTEEIDGVEWVRVINEGGGYQLKTNTNGLIIHKIETQYDGLDSWEQTIFDPPLVYFPAEISIGEIYGFDTMCSYSDTTSNHDPQPLTSVVTFEAVDTITVPAGIFECLRIRIELNPCGIDDAFQTQTVWFGKNIGIVKITGVNSVNGEVTDTHQHELVSATVNGVSY